MSLDRRKLDTWQTMQRLNRARQSEADPQPALQEFDGGSTSDGMTVPIKDYVDARDDAVESRLMAKFDTLATKDEIRNASASTRANIWGGVATTIAIVLGVLAFAGDRFDAGIGQADQRQAQLQRDQEQDSAAKDTQRKFDELLRRIPAKR